MSKQKTLKQKKETGENNRHYFWTILITSWEEKVSRRTFDEYQENVKILLSHFRHPLSLIRFFFYSRFLFLYAHQFNCQERTLSLASHVERLRHSSSSLSLIHPSTSSSSSLALLFFFGTKDTKISLLHKQTVCLGEGKVNQRFTIESNIPRKLISKREIHPCCCCCWRRSRCLHPLQLMLHNLHFLV